MTIHTPPILKGVAYKSSQCKWHVEMTNTFKDRTQSSLPTELIYQKSTQMQIYGTKRDANGLCMELNCYQKNTKNNSSTENVKGWKQLEHNPSDQPIIVIRIILSSLHIIRGRPGFEWIGLRSGM